MSKVNNYNSDGDFIYWLGTDLSIKILTFLDDPADIICVSAVSNLWHQFVIENHLSKQLCFKKFPEISNTAHGIEKNKMIEPFEFGIGCSRTSEWWNSWGFLKRNHRVYSFLAKGLSPVIRNDCISLAISASSTDYYPTERIQNTLEARDRFDNGASSYWSSKGESDPSVPETLLYKLASRLCLITEIDVQPFQAYFQPGSPLYSCKSVRFKMGHVRDQDVLERAIGDNIYIAHDDRFVWTYMSPEFPMTQENVLQKFVLPEPALCVGGFLLVELLGRNQIQDIDGLYYICVAHVQVVGRPLSQAFDAEILGPSGKCSLKYFPKNMSPELLSTVIEAGESSRLRTIISRFMSNRLRTIISLHPTVFGEDQPEA